MKNSRGLYGQSHSHDDENDYHHYHHPEAQDMKRPPSRPHRHSAQSSNGRSGDGSSNEDETSSPVIIDLVDDTDDDDDEIIKEQRTNKIESPSSSPMVLELAEDEDGVNSINNNKRKSSESLLPREKTKKIKTEDAASSITTKHNTEKSVPLDAPYNKLPSDSQQSFPCEKTTKKKIKTELATATDNASSASTIVASKLIKAKNGATTPAPTEILSDPVLTGILSYDDKNKRYVIRGDWSYNAHTNSDSSSSSSQWFELSRDLDDGEKRKLSPKDGEFHGSFAYPYFVTNSKGKKKTRTAVIPEINIQMKFTKIQDVGDKERAIFQVDSQGKNKIGTFLLNGTATPIICDGTEVGRYEIKMVKRYFRCTHASNGNAGEKEGSLGDTTIVTSTAKSGFPSPSMAENKSVQSQPQSQPQPQPQPQPQLQVELEVEHEMENNRSFTEQQKEYQEDHTKHADTDDTIMDTSLTTEAKALQGNHVLQQQHQQQQPILKDSVKDNDVLMRMGELGKDHPGNVALKEAIEKKYDTYVNDSEQQSIKSAILDRIIEDAEEGGGRFLKSTDQYGTKWSVVTDVREKRQFLYKALNVLKQKRNSNLTDTATSTNSVPSATVTAQEWERQQKNATNTRKQTEQIHNFQRHLLLLNHAARCKQTGQCKVTECSELKLLWEHISNCQRNQNCWSPSCTKYKKILNHYRNCKDANCNYCAPVRVKLSAEERFEKQKQFESQALGKKLQHAAQQANQTGKPTTVMLVVQPTGLMKLAPISQVHVSNNAIESIGSPIVTHSPSSYAKQPPTIPTTEFSASAANNNDVSNNLIPGRTSNLSRDKMLTQKELVFRTERLGLEISTKDEQVVVRAVKNPLFQDQIRVGDFLISVGNINVTKKHIEDIRRIISLSKRPTVIKFLTHEVQISAGRKKAPKDSSIKESPSCVSPSTSTAAVVAITTSNDRNQAATIGTAKKNVAAPSDVTKVATTTTSSKQATTEDTQSTSVSLEIEASEDKVSSSSPSVDEVDDSEEDWIDMIIQNDNDKRQYELSESDDDVIYVNKPDPVDDNISFQNSRSSVSNGKKKTTAIDGGEISSSTDESDMNRLNNLQNSDNSKRNNIDSDNDSDSDDTAELLRNLSTKKTSWTNEEDIILFENQQILGNNWVEIQKLLPGRSRIETKNRYHNLIRVHSRRLKRECAKTTALNFR
ncbi:MAG: hypothetical protein ACI8RD_012437 [Bacillariaceae sp.]|jgi:hypothetical protein